MKTMPRDTNEIPVVVCTEYKGIFFGYVAAVRSTKTITLKRARCCVHWSTDVKGFVGLAAGGPTKNCRIGPAAPEMLLHKVTCVLTVSAEAAKAWESAPWSN